MSTYPTPKIDPELIELKTKNDEIKDSKYETENHDHEDLIKLRKIDNEYYKKKYKSLNKKKGFISYHRNYNTIRIGNNYSYPVID